MLLAPALAGTTDEDLPTSPPHGPAESAFLRLRQTARSIAERVRHALLPDGAEFMPLRVLVVDDHPDAAEALAAVLEILNCPARACHDGLTALAVAAEFQPQVCLLDLVMPGMDGFALADRLRELAGDRPPLFVATTALGGAEVRTLTTAAGFHYHLTKPVDRVSLTEALVRLSEMLARPPEPPQS